MARRLLFVGVFATMVFAASAPLVAQWAKHATPGLPRTPDDKASLTAPAPRAYHRLQRQGTQLMINTTGAGNIPLARTDRQNSFTMDRSNIAS